VAGPEPPDSRWRVDGGDDPLLAEQVATAYPQLGSVRARLAYSSVHDVAVVDDASGRYALKLYRSGVRTDSEIGWEVELVRHLHAGGAPVAPIVSGREGPLTTIPVDGTERRAVLSPWAPGAKPPPTEHTYRLLGRAAATIHELGGSFSTSEERTPRTLATELEDQLDLLRPVLERIGRRTDVDALADVIRRRVSGAGLERRVCHNDLTLDNVHVDGDTITVFDFDSAAEHWTASEPQGVFHASVLWDRQSWSAWRSGYSEIRPLSEEDVAAVPVFVLLFQFENAAWKLGLTPTSVGPLIDTAALDQLVDEWIAWAQTHDLR
jgi:Ser/Thr protein kinase RdoA (MazF antagonist)